MGIVLFASSVCAAPSATDIVERADTLLWGKTLQGEMDMVITTPTWSKTIAIKMWSDRPTKSFARIVSPVKEAGITSLRIHSEMWNYIPNIERTIKIPPSLMLQPWFGSDFTNDDMVKESSYVHDYNHRLIAEPHIAGQDTYEIEGLPKANAAVVWGKIVFWIRKTDFIPVKTHFFDERGELMRVMSFSDIRPLGGRTIPTRWNIQPVNKPGKHTTLILKSGTYDKPIPADIFSLRNLTQKD
ncbi:MAG: outer membrane lipoprotein-sorting protein [Pseudomonadota bacterium]